MEPAWHGRREEKLQPGVGIRSTLFLTEQMANLFWAQSDVEWTTYTDSCVS